MRHLLSVDDLDTQELRDIVAASLAVKTHPRDHSEALAERSVLLLFAKPSMRTRISFEVALAQTGAHPISYHLDESTLGSKETFADFGAVASRYVHAIVARLFAQRDLEELASRASVPVINGLTDHEHPCQAIADLVTMREHRPLEETTLAYVGDANNNVTHSLLLAAGLSGMQMRVACPPQMAPDPRVLERARMRARETGGSVHVTEDPSAAVRDADFVYADTWMSYHVDPREKARRAALLAPYRVDEELLAQAPRARFLHCLPATRGEEVTSGVLDSPASLVLDQAENRLHAQKAILLHSMRPTLAGVLGVSA